MTAAEILARLRQLQNDGTAIEASAFSLPQQMITTYAVDLVRANAWAASAVAMLATFFPNGNLYRTNFQRNLEAFRGYRTEFRVLLGVFSGAVSDYAAGFAGSFRALIANDLNEGVLDQAQELLEAKYKDAACIVAGVALETHLKELCTVSGVPAGKLDRMNADLAKLALYNVSMQKQVTAWAGRRNDAAHGDWDKYSEADVADMISGVRRFMAET